MNMINVKLPGTYSRLIQKTYSVHIWSCIKTSHDVVVVYLELVLVLVLSCAWWDWSFTILVCSVEWLIGVEDDQITDTE